jgi:hypothetical protein
MTGDRPRDLHRWTSRLAWAGALLCLPLLLADWPIHQSSDFHPHFPIEHLFGFFAGLSLISCLGLALAARLGQSIVRRPEGYYDE